MGPLRTGQDPHNRVTLDFSDSTDFNQRPFAFLVSEEEFDAALARIRAAGVKHYANFRREQPGRSIIFMVAEASISTIQMGI